MMFSDISTCLRVFEFLSSILRKNGGALFLVGRKILSSEDVGSGVEQYTKGRIWQRGVNSPNIGESHFYAHFL
jgi:hypothetical protein